MKLNIIITCSYQSFYLRSMRYTNYHSHCCYCDGKEAPEAYIAAALDQHMAGYGFSSHAPLAYGLPWPMVSEDLMAYRQEIAALQQRYADRMPIYCGLEIDYIPGVTGPNHPRWQELALDYTIGSVHFVDFLPDGLPWEIDGSHMVFLRGLDALFHGDIQQAVERYYALIRQMVVEDPPDIVGHLDKIKIHSEGGQLFSEQACWYQETVQQTLDLIAKHSLMVEVNTRGLYKRKTAEPYPSTWVLERMRAMNIPIVLNSDAHHSREVMACFPETITCLQRLGFKEVQQLHRGVWQAVSLEAQSLPV